MKDLLPALRKYLADVAGASDEIIPLSQAGALLPVHLGWSYDVYKTFLLDRPYHLLVFKKNEPPTPSELQKHRDIAQKALGAAVAFVFSDLPAFQRQRLVENRVAFIVPRRHIYLPMMLADFRERAGPRLRASGPAPHALSAPAQVVLLSYLQRLGDNHWPQSRWSDHLGYSRMTITRACHELDAAGLCELEGRGRMVRLRFSADRHALWKQARPLLRSPVARVVHVRISRPPQDLHFLKAGFSALARRTDLAEGPRPEWAVSSAQYRAGKEERLIEELPFADPDTHLVQRWKYPPVLLSTDKRVVDVLSLYLSFPAEADERVQAALEHLLEGVPW